MNIIVIGSGNLATQLSLALNDAGQKITQVFSKTKEHAAELASTQLTPIPNDTVRPKRSWSSWPRGGMLPSSQKTTGGNSLQDHFPPRINQAVSKGACGQVRQR